MEVWCREEGLATTGQAYMLLMGSLVDASSREERSERRWREFDWFSEAETREHVCDLVCNVWAK